MTMMRAGKIVFACCYIILSALITGIQNLAIPGGSTLIIGFGVLDAVSSSSSAAGLIEDAKLIIGNALNHGPFISEPSIVPQESVLFYLYTRANPDEPEQLWLPSSSSSTDQGADAASSSSSSYWNASRPTKFMTHGWLNNHMGRNCMTVKGALLDNGDVNVIVVDWSRIAALPYGDSVARINQVGEHIARMIEYLVMVRGSDARTIGLIGHSLGAHVVGLAGHNFQMRNSSSSKVGHIVGLDPAGPLFRDASPGLGLWRDDAELVEVVHSNAGLYGLGRAAGHRDFWVNGGGPQQPGCGADPKHYCAHDRAFELYAEALRFPTNQGRDDASTSSSTAAGGGSTVKRLGLLGRLCASQPDFERGACDSNPIAAFPGTGDGPSEDTTTTSDDDNDHGDEKKKEEEEAEKYGNYYLSTAAESPYGLGEAGALGAGTRPNTRPHRD